MSYSLSIQEALALLPKEIRAAVEGLPPEEASQVLKKLLVRQDIDFRPLVEKDLRAIKARTAADCEFGFKSIDVDLSWKEVGRPSYIALGAFAELEGGAAAQPVPVAFVVAEVCRQPRGAERLLRQQAEDAGAVGAEARPQSSGGDMSVAVLLGNAAPLRASPLELAAAMHAAGCGGPQDTAVAVWYIGVSYEYRRQGLGSQLLDLVREVAEQAGCKSMLLHVADYNPNAIAFYTRYGFTAVPNVYKQGERGRHMLMHMPLAPPEAVWDAALGDVTAAAASSPAPSSSDSGASASRGFGAGKKKDKSGKRRALPEGPLPSWVGRPRLAVVTPAVADSARDLGGGGAALARCRLRPAASTAAAAGRLAGAGAAGAASARVSRGSGITVATWRSSHLPRVGAGAGPVGGFLPGRSRAVVAVAL